MTVRLRTLWRALESVNRSHDRPSRAVMNGARAQRLGAERRVGLEAQHGIGMPGRLYSIALSVGLLSGCTPDEGAPRAAVAVDLGGLDQSAAPDQRPDPFIVDAAHPRLDVAPHDAIVDAGPPDGAALDLGETPVECLQPGQLDDACDPSGDCCGDGLVCADFGGGGRCVAQCDARTPHCGPQSLCVPLALPEGDRPTPGACLQSARCEVDSRLVCGPSTTCTVLSNITLCTRAGDVPVGGACSVFAEEPQLCAAGSTCLLGACRAGCDGGCGPGERCVDYGAQLDGAPFSFCFAGCDLFTQEGCAADQTCVIGAIAPQIGGERGEVLGACLDRPQGTGVQNQPCAPIDGRDWGDCRGGHLCQRLARDAPPMCLGLCDASDRSLCVNGAICVDAVPGVDTGVCLGDCLVWPGPGDKRCADGEICRFEYIGTTRAGEPAPGGLCRPGPAIHGPGEACVVDAQTGDHSCVQGHLCTELAAGEPPVCVKLCALQGDGRHGCNAGEGCVDAFGDPRIGVCLAGFRQ